MILDPIEGVIERRVEQVEPWYGGRDRRYTFRWNSEAEFLRLDVAACRAGVPIWLLARAAEILVAARGCEFAEAWDRLAFNLERRLAA